MMAAIVDRRRLKEETRELLRTAQVSSRGMTALYLGILVVLSLVNSLTSSIGSGGILSTFVSILTNLMSAVLAAGFVMYCMAIRQGQRAEYLTLFDGFSFVGKVIGLNILIAVFTFLWSLLFVIPGIIASYRYRFALYNLYENPDIGILEALNMSKRQTLGYKGQVFMLDLSYIGWNLLATLPSMIEAGVLYWSVLESTGLYDAAVFSVQTSPFAFIPLWVWTLVCSLWSLLVSLFYLPN
uniref:DUF975 family protein n=1 Tax=Dysosmobacter welbionis TaxID=2093857 RepID=UPI00307B20B1